MKKETRIYVINIEKFNARFDHDSSVELAMEMTEEQIKAIVPDDSDYRRETLPDGREDMSGCYTVEEFVDTFNYALDDSEISSSTYYIRIF